MSIMIPSCNAHTYMKFWKKNFAPYAKNATVKNIITINKYNVGMKSLDLAIIVTDTLKFYYLGSGSVSIFGSGSGFRIPAFPYAPNELSRLGEVLTRSPGFVFRCSSQPCREIH